MRPTARCEVLYNPIDFDEFTSPHQPFSSTFRRCSRADDLKWHDVCVNNSPKIFRKVSGVGCVIQGATDRAKAQLVKLGLTGYVKLLEPFLDVESFYGQGEAKSHPISMAGLATLKQFVAIAKRAALFLGNDSGAMHIAAAVGTPMVALFGPSNPDAWGPRGDRVKMLYKGLDCRACFYPTCERGQLNCMKQLSVQEVCAAAVQLLEAGIPPVANVG